MITAKTTSETTRQVKTTGKKTNRTYPMMPSSKLKEKRATEKIMITETLETKRKTAREKEERKEE